MIIFLFIYLIIHSFISVFRPCVLINKQIGGCLGLIMSCFGGIVAVHRLILFTFLKKDDGASKDVTAMQEGSVEKQEGSKKDSASDIVQMTACPSGVESGLESSGGSTKRGSVQRRTAVSPLHRKGRG